MELKITLFALLAVCLLAADVEAGWKFWKSSKKDEATTTTTVAPAVIVNPNPPKVTPTGVQQPSGGIQPANSNTNKAIAGAGDPGLVVGVGNTGTNIRNNARPTGPNPGTEVGRDVTVPRPGRPGTGGTNSGQGYRDWAVGLTGAAEGMQPAPKSPSQGPAITGAAGQQPAQVGGVPTGQSQPRPGQPATGSPSNVQPQGQRTGQPASGYPGTGQTQMGQQQPAGNRPGTPTGSGPAIQGGQPGVLPTGHTTSTTHGPQSAANDGRPQVSTLNIGSLHPGSRPGSPNSGSATNPQSRPGTPTSPTGGVSPTGGKSWADIAATNSRPGSPTPMPRPGSPQSGQNIPGQPAGRPTQVPVQPYGQPGHQGSQQPAGRPGSSVGGAIAGGAAGAAAGAAGNRVFSSNPTFSKGNTVTNDDLQKLSEALFIKDTNNAKRYITLNLQQRSSGSTDQAPQPLLAVRPEALQIPTIQKVIALYNNYEQDIRTNEYVSPAERAEESLLVDTFLSTNVMSYAMRFLADKGFVRQDYYEYKDTLRRLWFNLYSRGDGKIGSSGFEHVFLSELHRAGQGSPNRQTDEILGLHNWIYYYNEEVNNHANYLGYVKKLDLGDKASIIKVHTKVNNIDKPVTTMFVGTSPELEMALYTVCFYARPDGDCPVSLGGSPFTIKTHKFRYRGKDLIGSAYPNI
ncbi:endoribonuclease CG2145-like isoform X1 [Athalia rosae]|uniref:endoribonuclease CG2145-like isoform X1 n=1 Tax=Athalia rosae TaxID=37344 RepID=UPI0020338F69|nr:endoribonuclease CG2145-like isoform X1 [Athalia rosae]